LPTNEQVPTARPQDKHFGPDASGQAHPSSKSAEFEPALNAGRSILPLALGSDSRPWSDATQIASAGAAEPPWTPSKDPGRINECFLWILRDEWPRWWDWLKVGALRIQHQLAWQQASMEGERTIQVAHSTVALRFVFIPAGEFQIGLSDIQRRMLVQASNPPQPFAGHNAVPAVAIRVTRGYFLLDHEVTERQFALFRARTKHLRKPVMDGSARSSELDQGSRGELPVTNVTWLEAMQFCQWLQSEIADLPPGSACRLPTEIEWEYAARGPRSQLYPWTSHEFQAWAGQGEAAGPRCTTYKGPGDVTWRGVIDMSGNVSEWCLDRYDQDLYRVLQLNTLNRHDPAREAVLEAALQVSPVAPNPARSYRGGSFKDAPLLCQLPTRRSLHQDRSTNALGFRPVIVVPHLAPIPDAIPPGQNAKP